MWSMKEWEIEAVISEKTVVIAYFAWEDKRMSVPLKAVVERLEKHDPIIAVEPIEHGICLVPSTLKAGEEKIVARAIRQILSGGDAK